MFYCLKGTVPLATLQRARSLAHSKTWQTSERRFESRTVLHGGRPLPPFHSSAMRLIAHASVNPKQALTRWTKARRRTVPTLPRRRYNLSFSTRYIRSHFTSVSQSRPSAPLSMTSFSRAGRLAFWLEPISTLTSGARHAVGVTDDDRRVRPSFGEVARPNIPLLHSASTFNVEALAVRRSARLTVLV